MKGSVNEQADEHDICPGGGALTVLMMFLPSQGDGNAASAIKRERVKVLSVDNSGLDPLGIVYAGVQQAQVEIHSGPNKGKTAPAVNFLNTDLEKDKLYQVGDRALGMVHPRGKA